VSSRLPPSGYVPRPRSKALPADTVLWRVHRSKYPPDSFNPRLTDVNDPHGGRFDATERHVYSTLYAGLAAATALSECLLRDVPFGDDGYRQIPRARIRGHRASVLYTERELRLVGLCDEEALNAVAQDQWLITADRSGYHLTRHWAGWIRDHAPWAEGFIWPSRRRHAHEAVVLFGDRCEPAESLLTVDEHGGVDLETAEGADWINHLLAPHRARVAPPRRRL